MDRPRWEILVLAAAILVGALILASSMSANRYSMVELPAPWKERQKGLLDSHTGEFYIEGDGPSSQAAVWETLIEPVK
jgi:hypothetical protein